MASQGLFTQGITVDDLLKQRRVRSQANQQQMMDAAAQGARDPQRARMGSMFGSIIGKALGDNAGGADSEMEAAAARDTSKAGLVSEYAKAASGTDVPAMYTTAQKMINTGDPQGIQMGSALLQRADQLKSLQSENDNTAAAQQSLRSDATQVASSLPINHPLQPALSNPNVTQKVVDEGRNAQVAVYDADAVAVTEQQTLKRNSDSLALLFGKNNPETVAALTNAPTQEIYKKAVGLLDNVEKVQKPSDIISNYMAEHNGVSGRFGTRRDGKLVQLTGEGAVPFMGVLNNVTSKKMIIDSPQVIARKAYEYVNKNEQYKKISGAHTLGTRTVGLFEQARLGNSKAVAALYRTVSEMYNGDSKAASEIEALRSAGTITDTLFNHIKGKTQGGLTKQTLDQLQEVVNIGSQAINTTLGEIVSKEYRSRVSGFEDTTVLSSQLLSFFAPDQIMDVKETLDPQQFPEGKRFRGKDENKGKTFMVVAGHIIQL